MKLSDHTAVAAAISRRIRLVNDLADVKAGHVSVNINGHYHGELKDVVAAAVAGELTFCIAAVDDELRALGVDPAA